MAGSLIIQVTFSHFLSGLRPISEQKRQGAGCCLVVSLAAFELIEYGRQFGRNRRACFFRHLQTQSNLCRFGIGSFGDTFVKPRFVRPRLNSVGGDVDPVGRWRSILGHCGPG